MKKTNLTIRSIGTAAVTGALVLGTAGLAQADDSNRESESSSSGSAGAEAPIHFGGIDFGSSSSSSSDDAESSSEDDGEDFFESREQSAAEREQSFGVGELSIDPSFLFDFERQAAVNERVTDDHDEDVDHHEGTTEHRDSVTTERESSSSNSVEGGAPAEFGGVEAESSSQQSSDDAQVTSRDDGEDVEQSRSTSDRENEQSLDIGEFVVEPLLGAESDSENEERLSILD